MSGTLIVGASQAGVELAVALRRAGDTAPITLVGAETRAPYQRPPLSKAFLAGSASLASLALRTDEFYTKAGIQVVTGEQVIDVDDGSAVTVSGAAHRFDRLALTVGARPRRLEVPGTDLAGVCYLRTVDDALMLQRRIGPGTRVVVVGGGFIGLEVAAVARTAGATVTVVEATERLMIRSVATPISDLYLDAHRRRGVDVRLGAAVVAVDGSERVRAVELSDGTRIPADLVVIGVGIVPRTELAVRIGLACTGGIVVDAAARTSDPAIVAAGDCTVTPHPVTRVGLVRLESVPHAQSQARAAAASLLGTPSPPPAVPWFWSDQYELKLQIAGLPDGYDRVVTRRGPAHESLSVLYYQAGALLAVNAINHPADYFTVLRALGAGATIPAERAADAAVPLKELLVARARGGMLTDGVVSA